MRNITFTPDAFADFTDWAKQDKKIYRKIVSLINDALRQPFTGLGKPEPLKYELKGFWSRRITDEHRLVYKVTDTEIVVVSCRFHYEN
jgi:toxin YoeB